VFWIALVMLIIVSALPRAMSYGFSLPYIDHPDEPNYYHGGLLVRGIQSDDPAYYRGMPPGYLWIQAGVQTILTPLGTSELSDVIRVMRQIAVVANLSTLVIIALTAREALRGWAGDMAGLVAGAAWGLSPLVVENCVYALPDPWVYLLSAAALFTAVHASKTPANTAIWLVASTLAALCAVIIKYPALPALLPGLIGSIALMRGQRRLGIQVLTAQSLLIALVGLWLILGYGIVIQREGVTIQQSGFTNMLNLPRILNNLRHTALPLGEPLVWMVLTAGGIATVLRWHRRSRTLPVLLLMSISLVISIPWLAASFILVDTTYIRHVLPATAAVCILFGISAVYLADALPLRRTYAVGVVITLVAIGALLPMWNSSSALALERARTDSRAALHQWYDENLETGNVLVDSANHKTFNPGFGGLRLSNGDWASWFEPDNLLELSPAEWHARGFAYALLPYSDWQALQTTPEGRSYLGQMLYLRAFADARYRGPQTVVLRLLPIQTQRTAQFGCAIRLLGFDERTDSEHDMTPTFRFYWRAEQTPASNYSLFLHLVSADTGAMLAQADGPPGQRPTLTWDAPDETLISSEFALTIPDDALAGDYHLLLGLYDYTSGERLVVEGAGAQGDSLLLANVTIE
jgi:hypothetical protein